MKRSERTSDDQELMLSNLTPSPAQTRLALGVVLLMLVCSAGLAGPLSTLSPGRIDAFMPAYATATFVNDSVTAALLLAQFSVLRSPALLALASGYLWTGFIVIPWVLTFPGVLPKASPLGAGLQSTPWLYIFWHVGFILFVIAYALLKNFDPLQTLSISKLRAAILASVGSVALLVLGVTTLATAGQALMPRIMINVVLVNVTLGFLGPLYVLSFAALVLLWMRMRSVLDMWLMVVVVGFVIELTLSIYPSAERFTVGWYGSRLYALLYSSLLLLMLLIETTKLYGRLLHALLAQNRQRQVREIAMDAMAAAIAHEIGQPLTSIATNCHAAIRFMDQPNFDEARDCMKNAVSSVHRANEVIDGVRSLYKKDTRERVWLDVNEIVRSVLAMVDAELRIQHVALSTELHERLPQLRANRAQLEEVLFNLITNAIEAMHSVSDRARQLRITSDLIQESSTVVVAVEDAGTGIDGKAKDRVFDPFFTTKSKGMGIGLAVCRAIVESHGGNLQASANNPYGTIFRVTLPIGSALHG